jgi:hypothetical protein
LTAKFSNPVDRGEAIQKRLGLIAIRERISQRSVRNK